MKVRDDKVWSGGCGKCTEEVKNFFMNIFQAVKEIGIALQDPEVRQGHRLSLSQRAQRLAASKRYKSLAPRIEKMALMVPREPPKVVIEGRSLHGYVQIFWSS